MKNFILLPALMFCLSVGLQAADDCSKSADACKPQIKKLTPFMAEIKKAQTAPELKQGASRVTALKQGEPKARLVAVSTAPAPAKPAGDAPAEPPAQKETLSKPAWLLVIGVLLVGLYYFLKEGKGKRKRA